MKTPIPVGHYIKKLEINDTEIDVEFLPKKKIGLLMICLNERYWPYLSQVLADCKQNFLPHHNVETLIWTDLPEKDTPEFKQRMDSLVSDTELAQIYAQTGLRPNGQFFGKETITGAVQYVRDLKEKTIFETAPIEWPAPTLMRYHLFMQQEEKLKEYDYLFYIDVDMRVVEKISDEIIGEGLTAAEHPMYSLRPQYIPPYEPNPESTAYIPRLGAVVDEGGKPRFKPYYVAGGLQGGKADLFIEAMRVMRDNIDKDFNKNYTAIWNDESHWNKYCWDYKGHLLVLNPSYVYPDSLIKEYYEPLWGRSYPPKIITLTKPFTLSKQAGKELNDFLGTGQTSVKETPFYCPICFDSFVTPVGMKVVKVAECPGKGQPHALDMQKL